MLNEQKYELRRTWEIQLFITMNIQYVIHIMNERKSKHKLESNQ